jgi:uncharacterized protein with HEPN domain
MSFEPREFLRHILVEADYLVLVCDELTREKFLRDATLQRAIVQSLTTIGEASKQIPESMRAAYPAIEWRAMSGMRNRLVHEYFSIDYEIVWDVLQNKIPTLQRQIAEILNPLA